MLHSFDEIEQRVLAFCTAEDESYLPASCRKQALIRDLWEYVVSSPYYSRYSPSSFSVEIIEACEDALFYFKSERGAFENLFNLAVSERLSAASGKNTYEQHHRASGMPRYKIVAISKAIRKFEENGINVTADMIIQAAALDNVSLDDRDIYTYKTADTSIEAPVGNDGDSVIADFIADTSYLPEDVLLDSDGAYDVFESIERAFPRLRTDQRGYVRDSATASLAPIIQQILGEHDELYPILRNMSWFSESIYLQYADSGTLPQQREIARKYGIQPESLNRALKKFLKGAISG